MTDLHIHFHYYLFDYFFGHETEINHLLTVAFKGMRHNKRKLFQVPFPCLTLYIRTFLVTNIIVPLSCFISHPSYLIISVIYWRVPCFLLFSTSENRLLLLFCYFRRYLTIITISQCVLTINNGG